MEEIKIRPGGQEDFPALLWLWQKVFGDDEEFIRLYFRHFFCEEESMVLLSGGSIVSGVYMPVLGNLILPEKEGEQGPLSEVGAGTLPCSYIYSFGTLEGVRGRGFGGRLLGEALKKSVRSADSVGVICPAEESLFDYYRESFGYRDFFQVREIRWGKEVLLKAAEAEGFGIHRASDGVSDCVEGLIEQSAIDDYRSAREFFLQQLGCPFISFDSRSLRYQKESSGLSGGGLFLLGKEGTLGCCCVEYGEDGSIFVKELLSSRERILEAIWVIARVFSAETYLFRMPVELGDGITAWRAEEEAFSNRIRRFGMLLDGGKIPCSQGYFGFAFD